MKTHSLRLVASLGVFAVVSACATVMSATGQSEPYCNRQGAFEAGQQHARDRVGNRAEMLAAECPDPFRDEVIAGYNEGYASVDPKATCREDCPIVHMACTSSAREKPAEEQEGALAECEAQLERCKASCEQ